MTLHVIDLPGTRQGVRFGTASVRGVWRNQTIEVREQSTPRTQPPAADDRPPCAAPPGGWQPGNGESTQQVVTFVRRNPDRFADVWLARPTSTAVLVVPVASGNLDSTRRELEKLYGGNLCVVPARFSARQLERARTTLTKADPALGLFGLGIEKQQVEVDLLVVTEQSYTEFAKIGLHLLHLQPAVLPVR